MWNMVLWAAAHHQDSTTTMWWGRAVKSAVSRGMRPRAQRWCAWPANTGPPTTPARVRVNTHQNIHMIWSRDIEITNTYAVTCGCLEIRCPKLNMPANGGYKCSDGSYFNSRCEFFCAPGFGLKGQKTTTCQYNKVWSAGLPTCVGKSGFPQPDGACVVAFILQKPGSFPCLRCDVKL